MQKLKYLPKERLIQRFAELTGMSYAAAEKLAKREGLETISHFIEVHLLASNPRLP